MKKILFCFFLYSMTFNIAFSQYFTIEDIEPGLGSYLEPASINNLQWLGSSDNFVFSDDTMLYISDLDDDSATPFLGLKELNQVLSRKGDPKHTKFPPVIMMSDTRISLKTKQSYYIFDRLTKHTYNFILPDSAANFAVNPTMQYVAYTLGNNIYIQDTTNEVIQITFDSIDGIKNGDIVFRNEFGIENGLFWSPQGNFLAYYRKNETFVSTYPLVNIKAAIAAYTPTRYPMAGMKSEESDVWIWNMATKSSLRLQISGDREQYHTNLSWMPDESAIYLQHLNRDQDSMVLKSYSSISGKLNSIVFTETDDRYVEPVNPLVFSKQVKGDFFYQSERDGYKHIYYYVAGEDKLVKLTSGAWEVTQFIGFDESEQEIYFMATKDDPLENHLYKLDRQSMQIHRLTSESGTHAVKLNGNKTYFIDEYSNYSTPRKISLLETDGKLKKEMLTAPVPFNNIKLGEVVRGTILAADDSTMLYYRLTKPVDFKRSKKYPVVIYVYGGPHLQLLTNAWMDRTAYFQQYLAQHGIASFILDCRGSDNRGREFEDCIHRQTGIPQLEDQMKGIQFLKSLAFIDTTRIGVHGWSYGGYMTLSMMLNYPDVFKVGVAGGPVTNWKYYEVMYGERYMDRPEQNPEGYAKTNLLPRVDQLKGKLLIIHGGIDPVVVPQNSLSFIQEGIENGKDIDYFIYPTHEHNVKGKDRVHLVRMITEYFIENL
jgi:dipeptidyl-peptidase 4